MRFLTAMLATFCAVQVVFPQSEVLSQRPIAAKFDIQIIEHQLKRAISDAEEDLLREFEIVIANVKSDETLKVSARASQIKTIEQEKALFKESGALPDYGRMKTARTRYTKTVRDANRAFELDAKRIAKKYRDKKDFSSAEYAMKALEEHSLMDEPVPPAENADQHAETTWKFLGLNKQVINQFTFKRDGKVIAANSYPRASWKRLDQTSILFNYGPGSSYIVFHPFGEGMMKGFNSHLGKVRYIKRVGP